MSAERFISPCPLPSPLQRELLETLAEECMEVGQRAIKACRFGLEEVQPGQPWANIDRIAKEFADVLGVLEVMKENGMPLRADIIEPGIEAKKKKLAKYLQHTTN